MYSPKNSSDGGKVVPVDELENWLENLDIILTIQIIPARCVNPNQILSTKRSLSVFYKLIYQSSQM